MGLEWESDPKGLVPVSRGAGILSSWCSHALVLQDMLGHGFGCSCISLFRRLMLGRGSPIRQFISLTGFRYS